jgi:hypothetical protein
MGPNKRYKQELGPAPGVLQIALFQPEPLLLGACDPMTHSHPLASEQPSLEDLINAHSAYMLRLSDDDRFRSHEFTNSLNIPALMDIAGRAMGSECYHLDKIYEGVSGFYHALERTRVMIARQVASTKQVSCSSCFRHVLIFLPRYLISHFKMQISSP